MSTTLDKLRRLIEASDKSRYRIAIESGVAPSVLSRLVSGERANLTVDTADRIAAAIGHEIIIRPTGRRRQVKSGKVKA